MSFRITVDPGTTITDLQRMADALTTGVKTALDTGGKAGLAHAQSVVPVRTGNLQRSLYYTVSESSLELGGKANYTAAVEFGTFRMPARPFIRPGAEIAMQEIQKALQGLGLKV